MSEQIAERSPRFKARVAGVFEALEGLASAYGQVIVLGKLIISGNAATTAANIVAHQGLFWLGYVSSVFGVAFHVVWIFLFYELFKPVNKRLALLATLVGIVVCGLQALTSLLYVAPLLILKGGTALSGFTPGETQALAMVFLKLNAYAFNLDLVFFGFWCVLTGYLIFRSTFLPRILGVLLAVDGLGWMIYVYPPLANSLFMFIAAASALAEIPLQLWLLIVGVNSDRWNEQARATGDGKS